jgi:hypothetical protein
MKFLATLLMTLSLTQPSRSSESSPQPPEQCGLGASHPPPSDFTTCHDPSTASIPSAWYPWTHKPFCITTSETPLCVFTNAASPRAHGLSIIGTPDDASGPLNPLTLAHSFDRPFFAPEKLLLPRPYEVRDVPRKGKGAVATRRIEKGKALLVGYPAILALAETEYPADVKREEVQELLRVAAAQLGDPEKVETLARSGRRVEGDEEGVEISLMEDIMRTNGWSMIVGMKEYIGIFPDFAVSCSFVYISGFILGVGGIRKVLIREQRFNHACNPK